MMKTCFNIAHIFISCLVSFSICFTPTLANAWQSNQYFSEIAYFSNQYYEFNIDISTNEIDFAVLEYITNQNSFGFFVKRRINGEYPFGGHLRSSKQNNQTHLEALNPTSLKNGMNSIQFEPDNFGHLANVSDVKVTLFFVDKNGNQTSQQVDAHRKRQVGQFQKASFTNKKAGEPNSNEFYKLVTDFTTEKITAIAIADHHRYLVSGTIRTDEKSGYVVVAGRRVAHLNGRFETSFANDELSENELKNGIEVSGPGISPKLVSTMREGQHYRISQPVKRHVSLSPSNNEIEEFGVRFFVDEHGGSNRLDFSVICNRYLETPSPRPEVINNLAGDCVSIDIRGQENLSPFQLGIELPVHLEHLPESFKPERTKPLKYDLAQNAWAVQADAVLDMQNKTTVMTLNERSAKLMTGILKLGENVQSQPSKVNVNRLGELSKVDPAAGELLITPPTADSMGNTKLTFPLRLRPFRGEFEQPVSVTYDSNNFDGNIGRGWNISVPTITVDTRWGVPEYNTNIETDSYLFRGQELVPFTKDGKSQISPHRKAENLDTRCTTTGEDCIKEFRLRRDESYATFKRYGDKPSNYWWEIEYTTGVREYYGLDPLCEQSVSSHATRMVKNSGVLRGYSQWAKTRAVDGDGNTIAWRWGKVDPKEEFLTCPVTVASTGDDKALYLNSILYNDTIAEKDIAGARYADDLNIGRTLIHLDWREFDASDKHLRTSTGNYGSVYISDRLLKRLSVSYQHGSVAVSSGTPKQPNRPFVAYEFNNSAKYVFGRPLLSEVTQWSFEQENEVDLLANNVSFSDAALEATKKRVSFEYFDGPTSVELDFEARGPPKKLALEARKPTPLNLLKNLSGIDHLDSGSPIGTSKNSSFGGSIYVGVAPYADKRFSGGFKGAYSSRKSENLSSFLDVDGNGIADYLVKTDQGVKYCPAIRDEDGNINYTSSCISPGLVRFSSRKEASSSTGGEFHFPYSAIGAGTSKAQSIVSSFHADVDGDRLPDLVSGGGVRFAQLDDNGEVRYEADSVNYPGNANPPMTTEASASLSKLAEDEIKAASNKLRNEPVRVPVHGWRAPFSGDVSLPKIDFSVFKHLPDSLSEEVANKTKVEIIKGTSLCGVISHGSSGVELRVEPSCQSPTATPPPVDSLQSECEANPATPICKLFDKRISVERGEVLYFKVSNPLFDGADSLVKARFPRSSFDVQITYLRHLEAELTDDIANAPWSFREKYVLENKNDQEFSKWLSSCWSDKDSGSKPVHLALCTPDQKSPYFSELSSDLDFGETGNADPIVDVLTNVVRNGDSFEVSSDFEFLGKFISNGARLNEAKIRLVAQILSDDKQPEPDRCECESDDNLKSACFAKLQEEVKNMTIPGVDKTWNWSTFSFDNGLDPVKERMDFRTSQRALIEPIHRMTNQNAWHLVWEGTASVGQLDIDNAASDVSIRWNTKVKEICEAALIASGGQFDCSDQRLRGRFRVEVFGDDRSEWSRINWPEAPRLQTPPKQSASKISLCTGQNKSANFVSANSRQNVFLTPILRDNRTRDFNFATQTDSGREKLETELTRIENKIDTAGKALPMPVENGQGYILPSIDTSVCDENTNICTYRFNHNFATHRPAWSVEATDNKAFEIELSLYLDGKALKISEVDRFQSTNSDIETGLDQAGASGKPFGNAEEFFSKCTGRSLLNQQPQNNCKQITPAGEQPENTVVFHLDDDNFTSGRDRIFEFQAKPGQRLNLTAKVSPIWNPELSGVEPDLAGYRSPRTHHKTPANTCSKGISEADIPVMSRDLSTLLEPRQSLDFCRPWYSLNRVEIRMGVPGSDVNNNFVRIFPNLRFKEAYAPKLGNSKSGDNDPRLPAIFVNNRHWSNFTLAGGLVDSFEDIQWKVDNSVSGINSADISKMRDNAIEGAASAESGNNNLPPIFSSEFGEDSKVRPLRAVFTPNFAVNSDVENSSRLTNEPNHTCGVSAQSTNDVTSIKLRRCFVGSDGDQWITFERENGQILRLGQASGRNKFDTLEDILPGFESYANDTIENDGGELCADGNGQCESERPYIGAVPPIVTKSESTSWNAALVISATSTRTKHRNQTAFLDRNGDGYPDPIIEGNAYITNPTGRPFEAWYQQSNSISTSLDQETSESLGFGISFPQAVTSVISMMSPKRSLGRQQANPSFGLGVPFDLTKGKTEANKRLIDLNGDGIADEVTLGGQFSVNVGTGQHGNSNQVWSQNTSQPTTGNRGGGLAINLGYDDGNSGFSGGVTIGRNVAIGKGDTLIDMNGDSRPDLVKPISQGFEVRFNTGYGFSTPSILKTPDDLKLKLTSASETTQLTAGMSFYTAGPPLCLVSCWLIVNPGINTANSLSRTLVSMQDFDGDGFTDIATADGVFKGEENPISKPGGDAGKQITQYFNTLGKAGRLKSVTNSTGSTIGLDYKIIGSEGKYTFASVDYLKDSGLVQPYERPIIDSAKSVWSLSSVVVDRQADYNDGGHEVLLTAIKYKHGNYSRPERSFLGFANVIQEDYGCFTDASDDACKQKENLLRSTERDFVNTSVYLSGFLRREVIKPLTGDGKISSKRFVYGLYDHDDSGNLLNSDNRLYNRWQPLRLSPQLKKLEIRTYENETNFVSSNLSYSYDKYGNPISLLDQVDGNKEPFLTKVEYYEATEDTEVKLTAETQHVENFQPRHKRNVEIPSYGYKWDYFQPKNRARRVGVWFGDNSVDGVPKRMTEVVYHKEGAQQKTLCQYQNAEKALFETGKLTACRTASDIQKWAGSSSAPLHDLSRKIADDAGLDTLPIITQVLDYDDFGNPREVLTPFNGSGDWIERRYDYSFDPFRQTVTETSETHCYVARRSSNGTVLPDGQQPFAGKKADDLCKYSFGGNSRAYKAETFISETRPDIHHGGVLAEKDINGHALLFDRDALGRTRAVAVSWQDRDILGQDYWDHAGQLGKFPEYDPQKLCARLDFGENSKQWQNLRDCKGILLRAKWQSSENNTHLAASVRRYIDPGLYSVDGGGNGAAYQDSTTVADRLGRQLSAISEAASCKANSVTSHEGAVCGSNYDRTISDGWKAYDALGRIHRSYYPTSWTDEITLNLQKSLLENISTSNSDRRCLTYRFDGQSRPVEIGFPEENNKCDSGASNSRIRTAYSISEAGGTRKHQSRILDPEGYLRAFDRDGRGRMLSVWEMQNDKVLSPHELNASKAEETRYAYNPIGELLHVKPANSEDVRENWISVRYDDLGRRSRIADPDRGTWSFSYDNLNQVLSRSFFNPAVTVGENRKSIRYDYLANRIWQMSYPDEQGEGRQSWRTVTYGYDHLPDNLDDWLKWTRGLESGSDQILAENLQGRLQELDCTNCLGQQTLIQDGSGLKLTTFNLLGQPQLEFRSTWFAREGEEELPPLTEIDRLQTRFAYDNWGMLQRKQFESLRPITPYESCITGSGGYSATCNLNGVISMRYDQGGRLGELRYNSEPILRLAYNEFAQKHLEWRGDGAVSIYNYDQNRRWLSGLKTNFELGGGKAIQNVSYDHDKRGLITKMHDTSIGDHQFDFEYDAAMRLITASSSLGGATDSKRSYAYDGNHRILNKVEGNLATGAAPDYRYRNPRSEPAAKWRPLHAPSLVKSGNYSSRMDYDAWGNLTRSHRTKDGKFASSQSLKWDHDNRMLRAEVEGKPDGSNVRQIGSVEFVYDHSGSRTIKQTYRPKPNNGENEGADSVLKSARTSGANKISERPRLRQGGEISLYPAPFLNRRHGGDGFVHLSDGGQRFATLRLKGVGGSKESLFYYSSLPNGSVTAITRKTSSGPFSGKLVQRLIYWPYGDLKAATEPKNQDEDVPVAQNAPDGSNPSAVDAFIAQSSEGSRFEAPFYAYSGKEWDEVTGLSYFGARYYNPQTALWANPDPIIEDYLHGSPNGGLFVQKALSAFSYANGSPISFSDPTGLSPNQLQAGTIGQIIDRINSMAVVDDSGNTIDNVGLLSGKKAHHALMSMSRTNITGRPKNTLINESQKRFLFTKKEGWLDMKHFLFFAGEASKTAKLPAIEKVGMMFKNIISGAFSEAVYQKVTAPSSSLSPEDIRSNDRGTDFGAFEFNPSSNVTLGNQIRKYLNSLQPVNPSGALDWKSMPKAPKK